MCFQSAKMVVDNDAVPNPPPKWGHSARHKQSFITRIMGISGQGHSWPFQKQITHTTPTVERCHFQSIATGISQQQHIQQMVACIKNYCAQIWVVRVPTKSRSNSSSLKTFSTHLFLRVPILFYFLFFFFSLFNKSRLVWSREHR